MVQNVQLPPSEPAEPDGVKAGGWWHPSNDGRKLVCDLCPRRCTLGEEDRGFCFVRQNRGGRIVSTTYGRSTGFCIDPIEKKPLNHFFPAPPCSHSARRAATWPASFARTGRSRNHGRSMTIVTPPVRKTSPWPPWTMARRALRSPITIQSFGRNMPWIRPANAESGGLRRSPSRRDTSPRPRGRPSFTSWMPQMSNLKGFSERFYWKFTGGHLERGPRYAPLACPRERGVGRDYQSGHSRRE